MIRSITQQKPMEEIEVLLNGINRVFIIGCGTCVTLTQTGGIFQVEAMKNSLSEKGKVVTGTTVVPVACDNLTTDILREFEAQLKQADGLLIMTCAFGVQTIARQINKMAVPALNTLFIGKETGAGEYNEVCTQCGACVIGETGGICPVTACHKGLVNGPCGGTNNGKCEIDSNKDCAWTMIYNRLKDLGRLDVMRIYKKPRNHLGEPSPGKFQIPV
ncbi:MAG: 5,10-methylenetetrahydrofolate reductase [Desulfobacterium sp.]|nr:5,10-methylenetetrahydrofolate reductase [Desulfobacterium sp.]MBU3947334.1 methylenetetrahydrofolate reductase C-terminal domain-containing protein [Pseudomonadota bacterium]MBU4009744.1 methylenetetrahydrofolate reductase C-terminal domain-containing protein [Pseudomonadota bacterium]MBU4034817.1 methylenetetrahydrofolate reductase C-terminal domain-containing protein [Pseudomonadota bacterium]